ncbi:aldo/keto reductase [Brevundimonas sp.]|uniref:aldo/keto reductase n=1 Tax=Brevundimonas sp. TaxID=1871086 RepID=UPI00260E8AE0|nr:aldo/keto reductase [Brevundimonas sp.]
MTLSVSPSPAGALAVAVVTAPLRSGPAAPGAREDALRLLLQTAADGGVRAVVTRPDGDQERLLSQAWPFPSPFEATVLTVPITEGLDRVEARARRSLERLGLARAETLLVSSAADLAGSEGRALWARLEALKSRGLFRRLGFVAGVHDGPTLLARRFQPDVVRVGCNLLDQSAQTSGELEGLNALGVSVQVASVFAHGALFTGAAAPDVFRAREHALSRVRRRLAEARIDPMQAALAYGLALPGSPRLIVSIASPAEMRAVLAAVHAPAPDLDWAAFDLGPEAPTAVAAGARVISSAA